MYKKLAETRISRGSNRKGIIASCIYKACKIKNVPRSAKEIADIFQLSVTNMTKGCKKFDEIMNLNKNDNEKVRLTTSHSDDFIKRFYIMNYFKFIEIFGSLFNFFINT